MTMDVLPPHPPIGVQGDQQSPFGIDQTSCEQRDELEKTTEIGKAA